MRYSILLSEQSGDDARNYPAATLARDIYFKVFENWERASHSFVNPVVNARITILKKIQERWDISLDRGKLDVRETFNAKLDKLFDILNCKCKIFICSEFGCPAGCKKEAHIYCTCPKEMKIPVKELAFIKGQRDKTGSIRPRQIGLQDIPAFPENKRLLKRQKREEERKWLDQHKQRRSPDSSLLPNELIFADEERQEHYSVCIEPDGRHLYRFTPDKCPKYVKPA